MSLVTVNAMMLRNAGANIAGGNNPQQTGISLGGLYTPACTLNGKPNSAKWEGNFYHQLPPRQDGTEVKPVILRVTAWNSRNAPAGKGLADRCAKYISAGKQICCELEITQFMSRVFIDNQPAANNAGQLHLEPKIGFRMKGGTLLFGNDAAKQVDLEIQNWMRNPGVVGFTARPPQWNVAGSQDSLTWTTAILPHRKNAVYNGGDTYGYAKVVIPQGAVLTHATAGPTQPGAGAIKTAEGFTIEQYRAQDWTDQQMLADTSGKFAPFIAAGLIGQNLSVSGPSGPSGPAGPAGPTGPMTAGGGAGDTPFTF